MKYGLKEKRIIRKSDKQIASIFAVVGITTLLLGFFHFRNNLEDPFRSLYTDYNKITNTQDQRQDLIDLKTKDTDEDGLNDYEELFVYDTSPYITDSDSDGFTDAEEVEKGHDPNCPVGQECATEDQDANVNASSNVINSNSNNSGTNLSSEELRQALRDNDVPEEVLNDLDDETLLSYYQEFLVSNNNDISLENNNVNNSYSNFLLEDGLDITSVDDLSNLSADEIRQLLLETGEFDQELLNSISDEELKTIFIESLKEEGVIEQNYE